VSSTDHLDDWQAGTEIMLQVGCPWYGAIGNHGIWNRGVGAAFAAYFGLPGERCDHAWTLGGIGSCMTGALRDECPVEFGFVERTDSAGGQSCASAHAACGRRGMRTRLPFRCGTTAGS
jgi:hypothetical protein